MSFDMERLKQQAAEMQEQVQRMQDEAAQETAQSSVGGGLVKVTRPGADLSRESLAYRLELLEGAGARHSAGGGMARASRPEDAPVPEPVNAAQPPAVNLAQVKEAWQRTILPAVEQRSIPAASVYREARPAGLADDVLELEFPPEADFHRKLAEEPKNATLLADALYEVTGRRLGVAFAVGERTQAAVEEETPASEEDIVELVKQTFDAREVEE